MRLAQFSLYFFVFAFWLSSWLPVPLDKDVTTVFVGFVATFLIAAFAAAKQMALCQPIGRALSWIAGVILFLGSALAFLIRAVGTPADGALAMFFVAGIVAFLGLISTVLKHLGSAKLRLGVGGMMLLSLAAWSWVSAFSMFSYRGVGTVSSAACILVPSNITDYDTELTSVWHMRLPDFWSNATGPTGSTILIYHAILVSPGNTPDLYNWSKLRLRFEPLSRDRNRYLPERCPEQPQ